VSAEVPKLRHRLSLGDPSCGDRPPTEVVVVLADPAVLRPVRSFSTEPDPLRLDDRAMAFEAVHRFEYV
jgi:hypothetical protein